MTFEAFQATRVYGVWDDGTGHGFTYADDYRIAYDDQTGGYHLAIENTQWAGHDLERLERILWAWVQES